MVLGEGVRSYIYESSKNALKLKIKKERLTNSIIYLVGKLHMNSENPKEKFKIKFNV